MKTNILKLESIGAFSVGGRDAGNISLIYSFLLQEYNQDFYNYIHINHIDNDLNEIIVKDGESIYINIFYPLKKDFQSKGIHEKNSIRLDIVHNALVRIAVYDKKLNVPQLNIIRQKILENKFSFDFVLYSFKKSEFDLHAKVIIHPKIKYFMIYVLIFQNDIIKCKSLIYLGRPLDIYFKELFSTGKWKNDKVLVISGRKKEVEITIRIDDCKIEVVNLTKYEKAPYFEMMKGDLTTQEINKAYQDWVHSLPPSHAAIIRDSSN